MHKIYKYALRTADLQTIEMPKDSVVLHTDVQRNVITLWALVDTDAEMVVRTFIVKGTGHEIPDGELAKLKHVGSVTQQVFVWHIFERIG